MTRRNKFGTAPATALQVQVREYCREIGLLQPIPEYPCIPGRKHRLDYAWPDHRVGLEIDGGMFTGGRHGGSPSAVRDVWKRNELTVRGWRGIHVAPSQLWKAQTWTWLRALLTQEGKAGE